MIFLGAINFFFGTITMTTELDSDLKYNKNNLKKFLIHNSTQKNFFRTKKVKNIKIKSNFLPKMRQFSMKKKNKGKF